MTCFCGRCVPNAIPKDPWRTACARCGQEVRFGERDGKRGWWHREVVDHAAVLGHSPQGVVAAHVEQPADAEPEPEPTIEVPCHPVEPKDDLVPGGVRTITNLLAKHDWELRRLTHARGPYKGSKGEVLSISDTIVLGARGPARLDGRVPVAVASWRDGKFDFAFIGEIDGRHLDPRKVNATDMKNWIKGA